MSKRTSLFLLILGSLGMVSCGGSGNTESSTINPNEILSFVMASGHGTITIKAVTPTSGIIYYLGVPVIQNSGTTTGNFTSSGAVDFFYRPTTREFAVNFITGNNWHIDPGPITVDYQMSCAFSAVLSESWREDDNVAGQAGSMVYNFDRTAFNDRGHLNDTLLYVKAANQNGTYSIKGE